MQPTQTKGAGQESWKRKSPKNAAGSHGMRRQTVKEKEAHSDERRGTGKRPPETARSRNTGKAMGQPARSRAKTQGPGSPETQPARPVPQGQAAGAQPPEPPDTHGKKPDNAARQGHAGRTPQARKRAEGKKNPRPQREGSHEKKKSRQLPTFPRSGVSSA